MVTLSKAQIDQLLRESEQRLQRSSRTDSKSILAEPSQAEASIQTFSTNKKENLAVREVIPAQSFLSEGTRKDTAGPEWFGMPKTNASTEFKRDWQFLRMRSLLDPKHQKKALSKTMPKYSQIGEVIAARTDSVSNRLTRKEKRRTLLEEAISTADQGKLKHKFVGIQDQNASGKKAFYKKLVAQRRKRR